VKDTVAKLLVKYGVPQLMQQAGLNPTTLLEELVASRSTGTGLMPGANKENGHDPVNQMPQIAGAASNDFMSIELANETKTFRITPGTAPVPGQSHSLPGSPFTQNPRSASKRALKLKMQNPH